MSEYLTERSGKIKFSPGLTSFEGIEAQVLGSLGDHEFPIRWAVNRSDDSQLWCDVGVQVGGLRPDSIFRFVRRQGSNESEFNLMMIVPTGIGAEIGGHAGDSAPAAALLASVCDRLITHPNVLNASDLIHVPSNAFYVEGSILTGLLMGTIGLRPTRSNRLLIILEDHPDRMFTDAAVNAVNAARSTYGLRVAGIAELKGLRIAAEFTPSGLAAGNVEGVEQLWSLLDQYRGDFDAVAISSVIDVPLHYHQDYYVEAGRMVNPWGGVEAMLTHAISLRYQIPAAHSPMFESREIAELDLGVVDPRMSAEVVSLTFLQSVLRGLQYSPHVLNLDHSWGRGTLTVEDVDCLIIPEGCLSLPVLAALAQGITVVEVLENRNIVRNDLARLPWKKGQFYRVANYWEAAGLIAALRTGIDPGSVRRPLGQPEIIRSVGASDESLHVAPPPPNLPA